MSPKSKKITLPLLLMGVFIAAYFIFSPENEKPSEYIHNEGKAQGTYYSATYQHPDGKDLQVAIDSLFSRFNLSLSTYDPNSVISKINQNNDSVLTDDYFETMFKTAMEISERTNGAFDITVAPLVNAWGFGFGNKDRSKQPDVVEILPYIGYHKVRLVNKKIIKEDKRIMLDASAIAQGLSADLIARLFENNGCENYMIDIGGEIVCKGMNPKGKYWQIGIDKPIDDPENSNRELQTIISVTNVGLTTSGNYRQFYMQGGKKYAHTINPITGFPVEHNLLSATVVAPTSMQADAYATAFMVIGVDSSLILCNQIKDMECYLVYSDNKGKYQVAMTAGFRKYLK
ncbi:MAG: FAD:protein FMN transferase [Paludibacter sp.]|nr:FAD:protein FMN transferase [Paludibacter sp.]